jgi:hypothetical protein
MIRALLFALALTPLFVQAQDAHFFRRAKSSCSARSIDRFYCPWFGGDQFRGPYWDNGCSVKCKSGQQAVCHEATCESNQSGEPIYSHCECK